MLIVANCSINSGQYNVGDVIDIPSLEAEKLIKAGHATKYEQKSSSRPVFVEPAIEKVPEVVVKEEEIPVIKEEVVEEVKKVNTNKFKKKG